MTHNYRIWLVAACLVMGACKGQLVTSSNGSEGPTGGDTVTEPKPFDGTIPSAQQCAEAEVETAPELGRRLTNWEYAFTLQDTLGVDVRDTVDTSFDPDLRTEGFTNTSTTLIVNLDRVLAYEELATVVVDRIDDFPAFVDGHTDCTDFEAACQQAYVENVGMKLFRRPLQTEEVDLYLPLFDVVQDEGDDFQMAARLVTEAMLQSPQFLYRLERQTDEQRQLDAYEIASRLSYLVWSSAPDAELYAAAESGALTSPEVMEEHVRRMLDDPRSDRASERFVRDWLHLDRLEDFSRDDSLYPEYSTALGRDMQQETIAVAHQVLREEGRPLTDLFRARTTFASRELAEFYGFEDPQDGTNPYDLADHPDRVGVLTHAGVLATSGGGNEPSLVMRGLFVLHNVMCRSVAAPSADVNTEFMPAEPGKSQRFYSGLRLNNANCAGCHAQFDPLGYGFEGFDGVGKTITHDFAGNELDSSGHFYDLASSSEEHYDDVAEYMHGLAESQTVQDCLIQKPVQYALGRALVDTDACMLADVKDSYVNGAPNFEELMVAIATHPNFRHIAPAGDAP